MTGRHPGHGWPGHLNRRRSVVTTDECQPAEPTGLDHVLESARASDHPPLVDVEPVGDPGTELVNIARNDPADVRGYGRRGGRRGVMASWGASVGVLVGHGGSRLEALIGAGVTSQVKLQPRRTH